MPLATTAPCDVAPPFKVTIPCASAIPCKSSGEVSSLTSIVFSLIFTLLASNIILPTATPDEAASPFVNKVASFKYFSSKSPFNNLFNEAGSTFNIASSLVIIPSLTKSIAIFKEASAVLFPFLVCKIYNFESSIVNSTSCISLLCFSNFLTVSANSL